MPAGMFCLQAGQQALDAFHHLHRVGAGLLLHRKDHGQFAVHPEDALVRRDAVLHVGHIFEAHRIAVPVRDDHGPELVGRVQLAVGLNRIGLRDSRTASPRAD